jgi:peptidoglycan/xylan/chitin deacetylase (PgdA/CDA1 family)
MSSNPRIPFALSSDRPALKPPGGKPLIVQVVVNIENWQFSQPMPRKILPAPHGVESTPDVPNFSWAEYGMRCGLPRILDALRERGIAAGCTINAGAIETYPRAAEAIRDAGWEFIGHGLHQKSLQAQGTDERALIGEALAILKRFTGKPVQGWLGPGLRETEHTPDILKQEGLRYCSDWVLDDLPNWMRTKHGPLIAMPYSLELNDSVLHAAHQFTSDELLRRLTATLETFDKELPRNPRVLTIGLHPHLIGVPHRIGILCRMLDILRARKDTVFMTGCAIADWFEAASPAPTH